MRYSILANLILISILIISCGQDKTIDTKEAFKVNVRLERDPQRLHPMVYPKSISREVYQYLFLPLADYDPVSLELSPVLIDAIPSPIEETIDGKNYHRYDFQIRKDAVWEDGEAVDGYDYAFTIKAALHPDVNAAGWRSYLANMDSVAVDQKDPKKVSAWLLADYMLGLESASTPQIFPEHVYDEEMSMREYSLNQLDDSVFVESVAAKDSSYLRFAEAFNSLKYSREIVVGCGPYRLKDWVTDQFLSLERVPDYWAETDEGIYFQNNPNEINFTIIPDETAAFTALKSGSIDMLVAKQASMFSELQSDPELSKNYSFHTPATVKEYFIITNTQDLILASKELRQALAYLIDVEDVINTLEYSYAQQLTTFIHPARAYANKNLIPKSLNVEKAKQLLNQNGWSDTDQDGILDKIIAGNKVQLKIELLTTTSKLTQKIGLLFKEQAIKAGVDIDLTAKAYGRLKKEHLNTGKFQLVVGAVNLDLAPDDLYDRWHSDNAKLGTANSALYKNAEVDELIEKLRTTRDKATRAKYYNRFQEIIYDDQPYLFLYSPELKIIVDRDLEMLASVKRPGYFVNAFKKQ